MKIAIIATAFHPSVGGYETTAMLCAQGFSRLGHDVQVITLTPAGNCTEQFPFGIVRCPNNSKMLAVLRACDVVLMFNVALRQFLYPLLARKRVVISHQGFYGLPGQYNGPTVGMKLFAARFASNIYASHAIMDQVQVKGLVVPNAYDTDCFMQRHEIIRDKPLLFVGRLVHQKAADLVIQSVAKLKLQGLELTLSICGDGPERQSLEELAKAVGVTVDFLGVKKGSELAKIMNAHKIMIVPSRPTEGFGIVAVEGIASGCYVIGSDVGGVPEAIGKCGEVFPYDNLEFLTKKIYEQLVTPRAVDDLTIRDHLTRHTKEHLVENYLRVLTEQQQKA